MASSISSKNLNDRLEELHRKEQNIAAQEEEMKNLLKNTTTIEHKSKIIDLLNSLALTITLIQQERIKIMDIMKIQIEKGAIGSPSKKMRSSLPPPTSGSKWTFDTLNAYSINFKPIYSVDELLFQTAPTISNRAIRFTDACSIISYENLLKPKFPSDHHAAWLAKHLYLITSSCFGNMEASIEDTVIVLFNALGFNDEDLITVSRNRLNFQMSNKMVCADVDLTVFNLKNWIRLALVEDKRSDTTLGMDDSGEPQLIAGAIAAAMYNQKILSPTNLHRAISEPPDDDSTAPTTTMMN